MTPPPAEKVAEPFTGPFNAEYASDNGTAFVVDSRGNPVPPEWVAARLNAAAPAPSGAQSERETFEKPCPECECLIRDDKVPLDFYCPGCARQLPDGFYDKWQARASAGSARVDARAAVCDHAWVAMSEREAYPASSGRKCLVCKITELGWVGYNVNAPDTAAHTHSAPPALTEEERMVLGEELWRAVHQADLFKTHATNADLWRLLGLKAETSVRRLTS